MTDVVLLGNIACDQGSLLRDQLVAPIRLTMVPDGIDPAERDAALTRAEIIVTLRYDETMPVPTRLRFLQVAGAGYDDIDFGRLPRGAVVANAFGHEDAVAEYSILGMLLWCSGFLEAERTFRAGSWGRSGRLDSPLNEEFGGKTVGLIGLGHIGRAVARRAAALDARVIACTRRPGDRPPGVTSVAGMSELDTLLAESDFVVICCALDDETRGLIDARRFGLMRRAAVIINVARGPIVDEEALFVALRDRRIAGGVIDTWYRYPTPDDPNPSPSRFPFHELPNVLMTPHSSAWTRGMLEKRWTAIAENIRRAVRGEEPHHIVHRVSASLTGAAP